MKLDLMDDMLQNDTVRIYSDLPRSYVNRLNIYVEKNHMKTRKKLIEMLLIKFTLENTEEEI